MKKALYLILAATTLGATSCKKCQTCTTNVTQMTGGVNITVSSGSQEYCGDEYDDAPAETTVEQSAGGTTQTVTITCSDS